MQCFSDSYKVMCCCDLCVVLLVPRSCRARAGGGLLSSRRSWTCSASARPASPPPNTHRGRCHRTCSEMVGRSFDRVILLAITVLCCKISDLAGALLGGVWYSRTLEVQSKCHADRVFGRAHDTYRVARACGSPLRALAMLVFVSWWSDVHFWFAHRVMHPWFARRCVRTM